MPVIKSSKKRAKQAVKKTARNVRLKKDIRLTFQDFEKKINSRNKTEISNIQSKLSSLLDTASKKNIFHKNKVARRKARIAKMAKQATLSKTSSKAKPKKPSSS